MITKIEMDNVASFKSRSCLETSKKINLIYGLNGSGKTTISNYLQDRRDEVFKNCRLEGFNPETQEILVYNQKFVKMNFYESETQKGIFTLAEGNKEALQNIEKAKNEDQILQRKKTDLDSDLNEKKYEINKNLDKIQESVWKIKTIYTGGDRLFDKNGFLDGLKGNKKTLFEYIRRLSFQEASKTIDEIKKEVQELSEDAERKIELDLIQGNDFSNIEANPIFKEEIIGNQNSMVSNIISRLRNADWVKQGIDYFPQNEDQTCPFCQQQTLTSNLQEEIKNYFGQMYEEKVNDIKQLQNSYRLDLSLYESISSENDEIKLLIAELKQIFDDNTSLISDKIEKPGQAVELYKTKEKINKINILIESENQKTREFNQKLKDKHRTIQILKEEFWNIQRKEYDEKITDYEKTRSKLNQDKQEIESKIKRVEDSIKLQKQIISNSQKKISNIAQTIEDINKHLLDFGVEDFHIIQHDEAKYRIQREYEDSKTEFQSLSEGEKIVISFLYFVELCKGKENPEDTKEKIVVIDDPVSSLSYSHIFNIATILKNVFMAKNSISRQTFILTHNLYFYNELVGRRVKESSHKLFRIKKQNNSSSIVDLEPDEIQNEYQAYWSIIKDKSNNLIMANAMRNIIEYFFGFIEKNNDIKEIFEREELNNLKYFAFKRYIDRESHSDPTNVSDYKEFDYNIFRDAFKKIFQLSGYGDHYIKMMQE